MKLIEKYAGRYIAQGPDLGYYVFKAEVWESNDSALLGYADAEFEVESVEEGKEFIDHADL